MMVGNNEVGMKSQGFRLCTASRLLAALLFVALSGSAPAQSTAAPPATNRKTSTPYTGDLSIFDTPGRDQRLHIDQVMDILSISAGKHVADIGAGSGWFTVRAARRVTSTGTVYAVDINPEAIRYIEKRAAKEDLHNIKTIMGAADNPNLPANSVDAALLLKSYHEIAEPIALLHNLLGSLRPDARVGIIDRNGNGVNHGVNKEVVIHEADQAGYRLTGEHDDLVKDDNVDYFLVFQKR